MKRYREFIEISVILAIFTLICLYATKAKSQEVVSGNRYFMGKVGINTKSPSTKFDLKSVWRHLNDTTGYIEFRVPLNADGMRYTWPGTRPDSTRYLVSDTNGIMYWAAGGGTGGGGLGTVTSISGGWGLTLSPSPITTTGSIGADTLLMATVTDVTRIPQETTLRDSLGLIVRNPSGNYYLRSLTAKLGILTAYPTHDLSFAGTAARTIGVERNTTSNTAGSSISINAGAATVGATNKAGGGINFYDGIGTGASPKNSFTWYTTDNNTPGTTDQAQTAKMMLYSSGNLGIGTVFPVAKLHVNGDLYLKTSSNTTDIDSVLSLSGSFAKSVNLTNVFLKSTDTTTKVASRYWVQQQGYLTTEVDGSITNEGALTLGAGGTNSTVIESNTTGSTGVTISGSNTVLVTEAASTITLKADTSTVATQYDILSDTSHIKTTTDKAYGMHAFEATGVTPALQTNTSVRFTTPASTPTWAGALYWNNTDKTLSVTTDTVNGVTLDLGHEQFVRVVNKTGVQINDGQVVYIKSAQGNRPTAELAQADSITTASVIGVATQNIAINQEGNITISGVVHGFNTSSLNEGAMLYLSTATPGALTMTPPTNSGFVIPVAIALNKTNNGAIFVTVHRPISADTTLSGNSNLYTVTERAVRGYLSANYQSNTDTTRLLTTGDNAWGTYYFNSDNGADIIATNNDTTTTDPAIVVNKTGLGGGIASGYTGTIDYQGFGVQGSALDYGVGVAAQASGLNAIPLEVTGGNGKFNESMYIKGATGDLNRDGAVDYNDTVFIKSYLQGNKAYSDSIAYGDVTGNGVVDYMDLSILKTYIDFYPSFTLDQLVNGTNGAKVTQATQVQQGLTGVKITAGPDLSLLPATANLQVSGTTRTGGQTNYTEFEADGTKVAHGDATTWDDWQGPFTTAERLGGTCPTEVIDSGYYQFAVDTTAPGVCKMYMTIQLPHSWKEGSTIYPHVHYKHTTAQGSPTFTMKYRWVQTGSVPGAFTWYTMNTVTGTTNNTVQMVSNPAGISGTGKTISSLIIAEIYLKTQSGTGGIDAYSFDIHYEKDTEGSRTPTSK